MTVMTESRKYVQWGKSVTPLVQYLLFANTVCHTSNGIKSHFRQCKGKGISVVVKQETKISFGQKRFITAINIQAASNPKSFGQNFFYNIENTA